MATDSIAQLELPYMNACPRCKGRYKKCSLCFGTGEISDAMIKLARTIPTQPSTMMKALQVTQKLNRMRPKRLR